MNNEKQSLISYRLECSDEMMSDARSLATDGRWKSAMSRLYYAVFQAVSALMIQENIRIKSHSGAKAMLELHFIKTGHIEKKWGKFYNDLSVTVKKVTTAHSFLILEKILSLYSHRLKNSLTLSNG